MKRLLEWKQRMLQSPLTRKSSGSSTRGTSTELSKYYGSKQTQLLRDSLAKDKENMGPQEEKEDLRERSEDHRASNRVQDGRRSANSVHRYNSYSSDDEGKRLGLY